MVILTAGHLRRILSGYVAFYNGIRRECPARTICMYSTAPMISSSERSTRLPFFGMTPAAVRKTEPAQLQGFGDLLLTSDPGGRK